MKLKIQKRLAARILKSSKSNIWLDSNRLDEIKDAITKADVKSLIKDKAIKAKKIRGISGYRTRKIQLQKSKGRKRGPGSKKKRNKCQNKQKKKMDKPYKNPKSILKKPEEQKCN